MNDPTLIHRAPRISRRVPRLWLASLLALFVADLGARAALILDLPDLMLQPNQARQTFTFSVQNEGATAPSAMNRLWTVNYN